MKTIYTIILGGYDQLRNPDYITPGWRYVCITDTPQICQGTVYEPWPLGPIMAMQASNATKAKLLKWQLNFVAEVSIYHDGNFQVIGNLDEFIEPFKDAPFATRKHPSRTDWKEELAACVEMGKVSPEEYQWLDGLIESCEKPIEGLWENGLLYFNSNSDKYKYSYTLFWHIRLLLHRFNRDQILLPLVLKNTDTPADMDRQHAEQFFKYHKTHLK